MLVLHLLVTEFQTALQSCFMVDWITTRHKGPLPPLAASAGLRQSLTFNLCQSHRPRLLTSTTDVYWEAATSPVTGGGHLVACCSHGYCPCDTYNLTMFLMFLFEFSLFPSDPEYLASSLLAIYSSLVYCLLMPTMQF